MTVTKLEGKNIEDTVIQPLMNVAMQSRYPLDMVVMVTHLLAIMVVPSMEIQRYLVYFTWFACGTDGHISRFCSQMQSLADHSPDNSTLYPHGPQLLVNRDSHELNMQALTPGHQVDKRGKPSTQSSAKPNGTGNIFRTYPEVASDEDLSSEEFTHKTKGRLPMTAEQA